MLLAGELSACGVRRPIEKSCASLRSRGAERSTGARAAAGAGEGGTAGEGEGATRWCAGGGAGVERRDPESLDASSRSKLRAVGGLWVSLDEE